MNNFDLKKVEGLKGKKVMVRVGANVPVGENGEIANDFRLKAVFPTLKFLMEQKAKIILIGHLGRDSKNNLKKVFKYFKKKEKLPIYFNPNTFVDFDIEKVQKEVVALKEGEILLLDNIRATSLEKENSLDLAKKLRTLADVYVNEAFSVSHRKHCSISALPEQFEQKYFGLQFEKELHFLNKIKNLDKDEESLFILGGAKIATKLPLIDELAGKFKKVIVGGAIINNFYKSLGYEIGNSLYDKNFLDLKKYLKFDNLFIPNIVIVKNKKGKVEKEISEVDEKDTILDISPSSFFEIEEELKKAKIVFFNGPLGNYEKGFVDGTKFLLEVLANEDNLFIAGGGDTADAIFNLSLEKNVDFISTGGGSLIEFISTGTLCGIESVVNN